MTDNNSDSLNRSNVIGPEDYAEPACVLCGTPYGQEEIKPVPLDRILQKTDACMGCQDYAGAERLLTYWLGEAELNRDKKGQYSLHNELMGYYRKMRKKDEAFAHAEAALALIDELDIGDLPSAATGYVNSATVFAAFDEPERSVPLFEKAQAIYEETLKPDDSRLGALYNNMGLTFASLARYEDAHAVYAKALEVMARVPNGVLETAITHLNDANVYEDELGLEKAEDIIQELLEKAKACLDDPAPPRNGYYAFVCEKCAPTFTYYGWLAYGNALTERSEAIYRANQAGEGTPT